MVAKVNGCLATCVKVKWCLATMHYIRIEDTRLLKWFQCINYTKKKSWFCFFFTNVLVVMATYLLRVPQNFIIETSGPRLVVNFHNKNSPKITLAICRFLFWKNMKFAISLIAILYCCHCNNNTLTVWTIMIIFYTLWYIYTVHKAYVFILFQNYCKNSNILL